MEEAEEIIEVAASSRVGMPAPYSPRENGFTSVAIIYHLYSRGSNCLNRYEGLCQRSFDTLMTS